MLKNRMTLYQLIGSSWQVAATSTSNIARHHTQLFDDITLDYARCFNKRDRRTNLTPMSDPPNPKYNPYTHDP